MRWWWWQVYERGTFQLRVIILCNNARRDFILLGSCDLVVDLDVACVA